MCGPVYTPTGYYAPMAQQQNSQCDNMTPPDKSKIAKEAAESLAKLVQDKLGLISYSQGHIDPIALRLFIRAYWTQVAAYAHSIHDE
jgi:hypothetical protein